MPPHAGCYEAAASATSAAADLLNSPAMAKAKLADPAADPVLRRFCAALEAMYGDRIERIVLFGSRARAEAHRASDYDVAVFLKDLTDRQAERRRLADLERALMAETGEEIDAKPFPAGSYGERTPLMHEIRLDGIDLGPAGPPLSLYSPSRTEEDGMSPEAALYMAKARRLLGYDPKVKIEEGIPKFIEWFRG